ncbi:type I secretion system permease/ATPase [Aestuariivirga sp.]|uniref:type I secretion system permease/ATPase n=1 Tax=Aestuariivirga sp. TaxID=2650926 RepID=UPI0035934DB3
MAHPNDNSGPDEISLVYRESRATLIAAGVFSCIVNILMLTGPLFMLQVYDRVLASGSVSTLVALIIIVAVLYAYYGFLEFLRARLMVRLGRRVEERLRGRVFDAVTAHALRRTPGVGSQPLNDLATIRQYLSGQGPFAFFDMPWMPFYLGIIFLMHWMLGVASLFAAVTIFALAIWSERATRGPLQEATKSTVKAAIMTDEGRRNAEALHSLGMAGTMRERWTSVHQTALDHQTVANDAGGMLGAASRVLRLFIQSGILALGAYLAILHEITPGTMIAASIIMSRALAPVEQAVANWQQFLAFRKARERLVAALRIVPKDKTLMKLPPPQGRLSVENLTVMLPGVEKPLLQGLTFTVEPGEGIGVIGPTGAGKSTLARALVGIIPPTRGHIRLDGATLDQRDADELGAMIGYLPQDVQLFDGTAAQNISRFRPDANPDDIVTAAKLANVHDLIMRLPEGYNTPLGENGARLSTGQRQRVALARCLFGEPKLMVLDEPNSALDAEGEAALDFAIRQAMARGAAVVVIAHRPSALAAIPKMMVLSDGKTAALGPRDEIMRKVMVRPTTAQGNVERINAPGPQSEVN